MLLGAAGEGSFQRIKTVCGVRHASTSNDSRLSHFSQFFAPPVFTACLHAMN